MKRATWSNLVPRSRAASGFLGRGGGRWGRVPAAPQWYSSTVQVNGIYPFVAGTARPTSGAPLGRDMLTNTAVAVDHHSLYMDGVTSSPSMMLYGINGVGKSSTAQLIVLSQMARGMIPAIQNPLKRNEHTPLVERSGGAVFDLGPNARHRFNLLSRGPLGKAAERIGGAVGEELRVLAAWKVVQQAQMVLRISRGHQLDDIDDAVIEAMVDEVLSREARPVTGDLKRAFDSPSDRVLAVAGQEDAAAFRRRFERLGESIRAMLGGDLGRLLGGENSVEIEPGNRGGFCFDTSSIPHTATKLLSTAMLLSWSLSADAIDAHWELARNEASMAEAASELGDTYEPAVVWTGYTSMRDEFWYPMRSVPGIVDLADALGRSNRSVGTADMMITHSPKDMLSLRDPEDREKARGLTERSGLIGLMALTREDLESLSEVRSLTREEIQQVLSFNAAQSWGSTFAAGSSHAAPPGAGKLLLKVEGRPGVPVKVTRTETQAGLHVTDERFRTQRRVTMQRRAR